MAKKKRSRLKDLIGKVSVFANTKQSEPCETLDLDALHEHIKQGRWLVKVANVRSKTYGSKESKLQKDKLPAIAISGEFKSRSRDADCSKNNFKPSGLIEIDIDYKDNRGLSTRKILDPECCMQYVSCSGKGLKVIYRCKRTNDPFEYRQIFEAILLRLKKKGVSIKIDPVVKSIKSLHYVSYDPNVFYNPGTNLVIQPLNMAREIINKTPRDVSEELQQLGDYIDAIGQQDVAKDYGTFRDLAFGISFGLGEPGRDSFKRICEKYEGEVEITPDEMYDIALERDLKAVAHPITMNSVYAILRKYIPKSEVKSLQKKYENAESNSWLRQHVFLIPSAESNNKFAHVLRDNDNICDYFESLGNGAASELLLQRIAAMRGVKEWRKFDNDALALFDENKIQRDTATECFLYFLNGTLRVTSKKKTFVKADDRPLVWRSLVLPRKYKVSRKPHPISKLAKKVVVSYETLQIAIGYLLHRYWARNSAKLVWACDHNPASRHDGRRGKDLFTTIVSLCRKWTAVKWKKGSNFWTSSIQPDTNIVHFEDVDHWLSVDEEMKRSITGDLQIEHKGVNIINRKFADKPKFSASSQRYPQDYMDASIRGRIWLVEFTNYLQTHVPKKTLVYDDKDLSSFDAWMIDCIQCYFRNTHKLIGAPAVTNDQRTQSLRVTYGDRIIEAVKSVKQILDRETRITTDNVQDILDMSATDGKTLTRFKEAFKIITGTNLIRSQKRIGGRHVPFYELSSE